MYLPIRITREDVTQYTSDDEGNVTETVISGYAFDEYRVNHAVGLPTEAVEAMADAFGLSCQALKILGVM